MFLVYGITSDSEPLVWEVAVLETEDAARQYAALCLEAANAKFNNELTKGFEYSDSINIQNIYDVNAQYHQYNRPEVEGGPFSVNLEYLVREIMLVPSGSISDFALYRKLKGDVKFGKSYKWPEDDSYPEDYEDKDDYDLRTHHTRHDY